MKKKSRIFGLKVVFAALLSPISDAYAQSDSLSKPILKIKGNVEEVPFLWEAMVSPSNFKTKVTNDSQAKALSKKIKTLKPKSLDARLSHLEKISALISFYSSQDSAKGSHLKALRSEIKRYSKVAERYDGAPQKKSDVFHYHNLVGRYFLSSNKPKILGSLLKISDKLEQPFKQRIHFLSNIHLTYSSYTASQGIKELSQLRTSFKGESLVALELAAARALAGLDERGEKIRNASPKYKNILNQALNLSRNIEPNGRDRAADFAFGVWRKSSPGSSISSPPFLVRYMETLTDAAIKERSVAQSVKKGNLAEGLRFYKSIQSPFEKTKEFEAIFHKVLQLEEARYKKTGSAQDYYQALVEAQSFSEKHKKKVRPKKGISKMVSAKKQKLILNHLNLASKKGAQKNIRREAIRFANLEIKRQPKNSGLNKIKNLLAEIYFLDRKHHKAEKLLRELVSETKNPSLNSLLALLKSQRALFGWPESPPWNKLPPTELTNRRKLAKTYKEIARRIEKEKASDKLLWNINGNYLLLQLSFGDRSGAISTFTNTLAKKSGKQASLAASTLIKNLYQDKAYTLLSRTLRTTKKKNLSLGSIGKKKLAKIWRDTSYVLGTASKSSKEKTKHYSQFLANEGLSNDPRSPEVYRSLARLYKSIKKPKLAVNTIEKFLVKHKGHKQRGRFLLEGHNLAFSAKLDEPSAAFGLTFIKENSNREVPKVRSQLIKIMSRQKAIKTLAKLSEDHAKDSRVSMKERSKAALRALAIYKKFNRDKKATSLANTMARMAPNNPRIMAAYVTHFAEKSAKRGNKKRLLELSSKLSRFNNKVIEVANAKGFINFSVAKLSLPSRPAPLRGNPRVALKKSFDNYSKVWSTYDNICQGELNTYCGPAKFHLAVYTERVIAALDEMNLPSNISQSEVNSINNLRDKRISKLKGLLKQSLNVSFRLAKEGNTPPEWRGAILKGHDRYKGTGIIAR